MNWNKIGQWVLLLGSLVLGVLAGWGAFVIFEAKVPAAMQTAMLAAEARVYYLSSGLVFGFVIFGWTWIGIRIASNFAVAKTKRESTPKK